MEDIGTQKALSERELAIFNAELDRGRRHTLLAYLLWFGFGILGVHNFYIGRVGRGVGNLLLVTIGPIAIVVGLILNPDMLSETDAQIGSLVLAASGAIGFAVSCLLWVWDLFAIPLQLRRQERVLRKTLLARILAERTSSSLGAA